MTAAARPFRVLVITGPARDKEKRFWLRRYAPPGFDVEVSTIPLTDFTSLFHRIRVSLAHNLRMLPRLNRYDAVFSVGSLGGALIALVQTLTGRLFIRTPHVTLDIALPRLLAQLGASAAICARIVFASVRTVVCYSKTQKRFWEERLGGRGRTAFVPIGIDLPALDGTKTASGNYLFCAGRAGRDYGTLLAAMDGLDAELVIAAGKDPLPDASATSPLADLAALPNVRVLEEIPYAEYRSLMAGAALVALPLAASASVFGQVVLLEAMALGKPVVVSRVNGTTDYVIDGTTGYFAEPGDAASFRAAITRALDDPAAATAVGTTAAEAVHNEFTEEVMTGRFVRILEKAAGRNTNTKRGNG